MKKMRHLMVAAALALAAAAPRAAGAFTDGYIDNPCTTVPLKAVADIFGVDVKAIAPESDPSTSANRGNECRYRVGAQTAQVVATRDDTLDEANKKFKRTTLRMAAVYKNSAPVSGLGTAVSVRTTVYAQKGTAIYTFDVFGVQGPATLAKSVQLAKATMPHVAGTKDHKQPDAQ